MPYLPSGDDSRELKYTRPKINRLDEAGLQKLDQELQNFMEEREVMFPEREIVRVLNETKWMQSKGGLNETGSVIITGYTPAVFDLSGRMKKPIDTDPIIYEQLDEDLRQWKSWKATKEFIEMKKVEAMQKTADSLGEQFRIND